MIALLAVLLAVVNAPYTPASYACDGVTVAYTVNFPYLTQTDLGVTSTTAGGAVTNLVLTTDYLLNVTSTTSIATLTLQAGSKCPSGSTLKIVRQMACTQPTSLGQQLNFNPRTVETISDRSVMCSQQIQAQVASTQNLNFGALNTFTATQTFAPAAGSDAIVAAATGTGRAVVASSASGNAITATATVTGAAGQFNGNANDGPIQIVGQSSDPAAPANGEVWLNSTQGSVKARVGGVTQQISGNPFLGANTAAGQSIPNNAATIVVFGTVELDTDSGYNSGTGRYTVPVGKGGHYIINATIDWNASPAAGSAIQIFKNAGALKSSFQQVAAAGVSHSIAATVVLVAGDIIDIRVFQASGGAVVLAAFADRNYLSIKRIPD